MTDKKRQLDILIADAEARKQALNTRDREIKRLLNIKQQEYDTAEVAGENTRTIKKELHELEEEAAEVTRALQAFKFTDKDMLSVHKGNKKIVELAEEVIGDNLKSIADLQEIYKNKAAALNKLKAAFLQTVSELGELKKTAQELAGEASRASKYVPGKEHNGYGGIVEGINYIRHEGSIYINTVESEKAFKEGIK